MSAYGKNTRREQLIVGFNIVFNLCSSNNSLNIDTIFQIWMKAKSLLPQDGCEVHNAIQLLKRVTETSVISFGEWVSEHAPSLALEQAKQHERAQASEWRWSKKSSPALPQESVLNRHISYGLVRPYAAVDKTDKQEATASWSHKKQAHWCKRFSTCLARGLPNMWGKVIFNSLIHFTVFLLASGDSGGDYFKAIQPVFKNPGKYGPWILPTKGKVWPKPKVEKEIFGRFSILEPSRFEFLVSRTMRGPSRF